MSKRRKRKTEHFNEAGLQAGTAEGMKAASEKSIAEAKFHGSRGHGFAAERGNDLYDRLRLRHTKIVGDSNVKGGPDRIVENILIQSKYCRTARESINACFKNGVFQYPIADGTPMTIEVASDQYSDAVPLMAEKIRQGMVPGVTDPADASKIIRKGHYTYAQAKNAAKPGTIESLKYDVATGIITAGKIGSVSFVLSFAIGIWNGKTVRAALDDAWFESVEVFGTVATMMLVGGQLSKAGFNKFLVDNADKVTGCIGPRVCNEVANTFRTGNTHLCGQAARKATAKVIGNGGASVLVVTAVKGVTGGVDVARRRVSVGQYFKDIICSGVSACGGLLLSSGGRIVGDKLLPGVGGHVFSIVGGLVGGKCFHDASEKVMGKFIEDDSIKMRRIVLDTLTELSSDYLLTPEDTEAIWNTFLSQTPNRKYKEMYAADDRTIFASNLLVPIIEKRIQLRQDIVLPDKETLLDLIKKYLDGEGDFVENLT